MEELVYKPDYQIGRYIGLGAMLLLGIGFAWASYGSIFDPMPGRSPQIYPSFVMAAFAAFFLGFPARQVREIRFGDKIVAKRYLWPSDTYPYEEVYHLSQKGIELESGSIRLRNVKEESLEELRELMQELTDRGRLREEQLKDETMLPKAIMRSVAVWVSVGIGVLTAAIVWGAEFAEPVKAYVQGFYGRGDSVRPFMMIAAVAAVLSYLPLARMAQSMVEQG
jgi:hypothetical protein